MRIFSIPVLLVFCMLSSSAQVITVKQDGTGDYTTIQAAVDSSADGDTVLVWPGIYFENVICEDKNITLASLVLTTGNLSYASQTVINGNQTGSCIKIRDCQQLTVINGFTLTNGSGSYHGGIDGGGIITINSRIKIYNCTIQDNKVTGFGGGLYFDNCEVFLSGTTIRNNHSYASGGGILSLLSDLEFDSASLCNIYLNYADQGSDIFKAEGAFMNVILDTFTVISPDYYYIFSYYQMYPTNDFTYQINEGKISQSYEDLYVSPVGNDMNTGVSPGEPLKTISFALLKMASDSLSPDTIHLADGLYAPSTGEKFPLSLKRNVSIQGASRDQTILDGEDEIYIMNCIVFADNYKISKLTIQNGNSNENIRISGLIMFENHHVTIEDVLVTGNNGSISCYTISHSNNILLKNVEFNKNIGGDAFRVGTITSTGIFSDTVILKNCLFIENLPDYSIPDEGFGGGALVLSQMQYPDSMTCYFYNCLFSKNHGKVNPYGASSNSLGLLFGGQAFLVNCTLGDNTSDNPQGANIGVTYNSDLHIFNSIIYNNEPAEIYMYAMDTNDCDLNIYNSLVAGGEEGIRILSPWNNVYYESTNIDADPLWDTAGPYPYMLTEGSPCIDAGTLDLPPGVELPEFDLAGNPRVWGESVDMGAYEYGPWVKVPEIHDSRFQIPYSIFISVSPNPFTYGTYIKYEATESGKLDISVYDLNGRFITALINSYSFEGSGEFYWDGTAKAGYKLTPGVYIIKMTLNDELKGSMKVVKEK